MKYWKFQSPIAFIASVLWNVCKACKIGCPFAPYVFGLMIGSKPRKHK